MDLLKIVTDDELERLNELHNKPKEYNDYWNHLKEKYSNVMFPNFGYFKKTYEPKGTA